MTLLFLEISMLFQCKCVTYVTVTITCDITFCLFHLCLNKEKEIQNKMKLSLSFTTLTQIA